MPVIRTISHESIDNGEIAATVGLMQRTYPDMGVLALLPEKEKSKLKSIQSLFRHQDIPLVGAIFPALLEDEKFRSSGIILFLFDTMPPYLLTPGLKQEGDALDSICNEITDRLSTLLQPYPADTSLFMLFDTMLPQIGQILENFYMKLADRVRYFGVNAGSETFEPMPCLFDSKQLIGDGMLTLIISPHEGVALEHGYRAPQHMVAATSTEGNRIINIDWRPAFDVYAEIVNEQFGVRITPENFYQYAVHFPFGIIRADSEVLVRIPVALMEDGSLFCVGEIPPNSILTLLDAPKPDSEDALMKLVEKLPTYKNQQGSLLFYCAGRRLHFGIEAAEAELMQLRRHIDGRHLFGALSLGEIGSSQRGGYPLFHNACLVATEL
ncbi:MAG: FIST N-terminal domain-containing protein [Pseudomonadota bacterium]